MQRCPGILFVWLTKWTSSIGVAAVSTAWMLGACENSTKEVDVAARATSSVSPSGAVSSSVAASPSGSRDSELCERLQALAAAGPPRSPERITLEPPTAGKTIVLSKTGVIVRFSRDEFLTAARCLKLFKAERYVETDMNEDESPLRDAFQLSYVAAALLDVGRVGVSVRGESEPRTSIVRDGWSAVGCAGACRSVGRVFRLSEADPSFFFRVTDQTINEGG